MTTDTQTTDTVAPVQLELGQLVTIDGSPGFFRVTGIPDHGKHVDLYGGTMHQQGKVMAKSRAVVPARVKAITNKATMKRAIAYIRAMDGAMESAPSPRRGRAGGK